MTVRATGRCLCGGVAYELHGELRDVVACHCSQCRQSSGNFVAATAVARAGLVLIADSTLAWYRSSPDADRGFCTRCGGNLFWRSTAPDSAAISVMAGTINPPTRLKLAKHIFVANKSDFYDIADGVPQHATWG